MMANLLNNRFTTNTYNPLYPGLNKSNYDKIIAYGNSLGLQSEEEKRQAENAYYRKNVNKMVNDQILDERDGVINEQAYQAAKINTKDADVDLRTTELSQALKRKYNLNATANDAELVDDFIKGLTPEGKTLAGEYLAGESDEFLYVTGLADRPTQQGGTKDLINQASENSKAWDDKNFLEKADTVTNYTNVVGLGTEKIDEAATKFADKITFTGEGAVENLKNKIDNMSEKELKRYMEQFNKEYKDTKNGYVYGDTLVEQLWNAVKGNIEYRNDDEAFYKWLVSKKSNLWESLTGADDALKGEENPNVIKFFGNIPSSAVKTFTATVRGLTNPVDTLKGLYKIAATEEGHQAILNRYGSWDAFAKSMNTDPVGVADDILAVAELGGNVVSGGLKATGKLTGSQKLTNAGNWVSANNFGSANDALANKTVGGIYAGMDKLADLSNNSLVQSANKVLQTESSLKNMTDVAKDATTKAKNYIADSAFGQALKNYVNEGIDKLVGVSEEDREFIRNNKDLVNEYIDGKKNVETVFDDVKEKISSKRTTNSEMGKEYNQIRANGDTASTKGLIDELKESLGKEKITVDKKGNLKFDKLSKYNAKQQRAIMDAWEVIKDAQKAGNVDGGTILDLRQKMDDKLTWDGKPADLKDVSAVDKSTEKLIKKMRGVIDNRAKTEIPGLKELDEKYAPALQEMATIKKDWLNSDGTFKDNARSKLRNLTKAGNEERLARLEKVVPGITKDLQALDVGLTIDRASKQGVGQYAKNIGLGSTIAFAASGNIPAALVSAGVGILSTPKNFVRLIEAYPDIVEKLQAGGELVPSDVNRLQSLAARLQAVE